ncbi:hypothetical protein K1T73_03060 [Roseovarius sp. SCSIO 43702]|uniref:hypothetical protein n=1 Tax=Roseovarius sp. SCSIO 43702 TaxID=2823043 RepID=UPI001C73BF36|nr:hypothetical protein [Roseovarius sp. SCSIO 43702]QYX57397.1 hypothetical protein K1T73_03060 [Roseovarius sp. SCSIO 43702]
MRHGPLDKAPNYTGAALVMGLVNLLWVFFVVWAVFGFWATVALGIGLDRAIAWLGRRG